MSTHGAAGAILGRLDLTVYVYPSLPESISRYRSLFNSFFLSGILHSAGPLPASSVKGKKLSIQCCSDEKKGSPLFPKDFSYNCERNPITFFLRFHQLYICYTEWGKEEEKRTSEERNHLIAFNSR